MARRAQIVRDARDRATTMCAHRELSHGMLNIRIQYADGWAPRVCLCREDPHFQSHAITHGRTHSRPPKYCLLVRERTPA